MQTNIYAAKENGDLRLIAEIEGLDDPALAVDALLDEMPRLKQREFVVIDLDNVMIVEAGDEVVQPRRQIEVRNGSSPAKRGRKAAAVVEDEEEVEAEEEQEEAPAPAKRGRARSGTKRGTTAAKSGGKASPFRSNPKSAD
jgi:hypothetical protein